MIGLCYYFTIVLFIPLSVIPTGEFFNPPVPSLKSHSTDPAGNTKELT